MDMTAVSAPDTSHDAASAALTPYDILKTVAVILMVIDHVGLYFFPGDLEMRTLGRLCVPIWLFLVGFANSRRVDKTLIYSAFLVSVGGFLALQQFYGFNILWTIILVRLTLNPLMRWIDDSFVRLAGVTFLCFIFATPTRLMFDYGTMAWIIAIWGHMTRRRMTDTIQPFLASLYGIAALVMYTAIEMSLFRFSVSQSMLLALGGFVLFRLLNDFLPNTPVVEMPDTPAWLRRAMAWTGRHTLEIYVAHLLIIYALFALNCHFPLIQSQTCPKLFP